MVAPTQERIVDPFEVLRFNELISILWQGGKYGYLWQTPSKLTTWLSTGNLDVKIKDSQSNMYFGVYPTDIQKKDTERAKISDIVALNCLFREYDLKDFEGTKAQLSDYVLILNPIPSVIVETAGGFHVYWLLEETIKVDQTKIEFYKQALDGWSKMDRYADSNAKDLARVLRIPGTFNQKPHYTEAERMTRIIEYRPHIRHDGKKLLKSGLEYFNAQNEASTHIRNANRGIQTPRGEYNAQRMEKYVKEILSDVRLVATAPTGQRTERMMQIARRIGQVVAAGVLDANDAKGQILDACAQNKLLQEDGETNLEKQIENAFRWASDKALDLRKFETYELSQDGLTIHDVPTPTPDPRENEAPPDRNPVNSEMALLGLLLSDGTLYQEVITRYEMTAGHFANPRHQRIFSAIGYVALAGVPDKTGVEDILKRKGHYADSGGEDYLDALLKAKGKPESLDVYIQSILEASVARQLTGYVQSVASINNNGQLSPDEKVMQASELLSQIKTPTSQQATTTFQDVALGGLDVIERSLEDTYALSTGYPALDAYGKLVPGEYIGLYGRPGMGKSAFALNIIRRSLKQGHTWGIVSLEMSLASLAFRMASPEQRIPFEKFPAALNEVEYARYTQFVNDSRNYNLLVTDKKGQTPIHILNWLKRMVREHDCHHFVLDHTALVKYDKDGKRNEEMGDFVLELRNFALTYECCVIGLGQLNRDCEQRPDKRPFASDVGESDKIVQHADRLWMVYRDSKYNMVRAGHENDFEILIRKNRDAGPEGTAILGWDGQFQHVYDVDIVSADS